MKRRISLLAIACLAGPAMADVTYTYTGLPLSVVNAPSVYPRGAPLTIVLDFASDGSALLDWSASQPIMGTIAPSNVFTMKNETNVSPGIYLSTDASGAVTDWFFSAYVRDPDSPPDATWFSRIALSFSGVVYGTPPLAYGIHAEEEASGPNPDPSQLGWTGFNVNEPGTWTVSGGVLPNLVFGDPADLTQLATPVPEPAAGLLLVAGLGLLAASRRMGVPHARVAGLC